MRVVVRTATRPGIHHQGREVLFVAEVAENHLNLAGYQLEHVDLVVQDRQDALFDASAQTQIEDVDIAGLANSANAVRRSAAGRPHRRRARRLRPSTPWEIPTDRT